MILVPIDKHNIKFSLYSDPCTWCFFDHDSTQGCLDALYEVGCNGKSVLEIGCGAGILDIYASKLGATHITAIDVLPGSLGLTLINCNLNEVEINLKWANDTIIEKYDIILMNIDKENAITYFNKLKLLTNPNGKIIMTFPNRKDLERELGKLDTNLKIISENNLPNYKTFVLEVDD